MHWAMAQLLARHGSDMILVQGEEQLQIRAFLQESGSKSKANAQRVFTSLGESYRGLFLYIGPVTPTAQEGDTLLWQERNFELRRTEMVIVDGKAMYCWGLCVEVGGESTW